MTPDTPILIVGAGTFGLSTAYRLAKAGYKNITVLEKSPVIPSDLSAGNDLNKILRAEYEDPYYAELALQALAEWKTPLFAPYYHETGYLLGNSAAAPEKSKKSLAKSLASISSHPAFKGKIRPINTRDDIRSVAPVFDGPMGWKGYFNRFAGYAHAADAMTAVYSACCAFEVDFRLGDGVESLVFNGAACVGAKTQSGKEYRAEIVVLALGASLGVVLPQVGRQVTAKAWSVGHVQLTPEEAARLRGIPVTYARDLGFFFEPDPRTGLLKLCPSGSGYTNFVREGVSVPPANNDWIPPRDEEMIRKLLRETLPALADRPIINKKMCWCADTADSEYVIDYVPGKNLLVVSGDSGHAFKMLPVIGNWVKEALEKGKQDIARWQWKEGQDASGEVSWRVGKTVDIKDPAIRSKL
ncbi:FAD dependent oxidoreductase [Pleurostoma richardsiae]|uniref:FAD dependent oxidoreductase n=1 Tax=Pleurostoma richardsiae TaxID=41990 RepID=A0AA38RBU5_9PEZI|nr:FAD dependent oxidoreductase [Pleurostoma richardsiae]